MQYWIQISKNKIFRTFICSTFIWSTHLSAGPIFQRFWFLSWFHWKRVAVNKKVTVPSVPSDYYFERFKVATMNWLIVTDYMCPKRPRICSVYRNHNAVLSAFMTCHRVHLRFWWVRVARSLVFCVVFCISLFVLLPVYNSLIYGFWLPLWYRQTFNVKWMIVFQKHFGSG